jgi:hypothetical protein
MGTRRASLCDFAAGRLRSARVATAIQPQQAVHQFASEPLAHQGNAHYERSKKKFGFHRATTPLQ